MGTDICDALCDVSMSPPALRYLISEAWEDLHNYST